jgi:hypothetical protein
MPKAVFISFDHDDASQVGGLRATLKNMNNSIDFLDRSLREPVKDVNGRPIMVKPSDSRAKKVKSEIIDLMNASSKMVVLIGRNTHSSEWVKWEIDKFREIKHNDDRRIICMRLKGNTSFGKPANATGISIIDWDLDFLNRWISF